jgi:hypothetical protein
MRLGKRVIVPKLTVIQNLKFARFDAPRITADKSRQPLFTGCTSKRVAHRRSSWRTHFLIVEMIGM